MNMKILVCLIPDFANIWTLVLRILLENNFLKSKITFSKFNLCFDLFGKLLELAQKGQQKSLRVHMYI